MAKILLVEDDISLRDVYFARLQAEGFELAVAANGEEALAVAVKERPDLIVLDIMMPRISGFDVLDIVRTTPEIAHTKVIMMTALGSPGDKERGEKLGVDKYLVKSQVTLEDVVATIKQVLGGGSDKTATAAAAAAPAGNTQAPAAPANTPAQEQQAATPPAQEPPQTPPAATPEPNQPQQPQS
jgi:DNA-binding response OmpR family regulator